MLYFYTSFSLHTHVTVVELLSSEGKRCQNRVLELTRQEARAQIILTHTGAWLSLTYSENRSGEVGKMMCGKSSSSPSAKVDVVFGYKSTLFSVTLPGGSS